MNLPQRQPRVKWCILLPVLAIWRVPDRIWLVSPVHGVFRTSLDELMDQMVRNHRRAEAPGVLKST